MSGGSTPSTSTTTVNNPGQQELISAGLPFLKQFAANPPQLPSGGTVAPFDPAQEAGQEQVLGSAAGPSQGLADVGAGSQAFLSSGAAASPNTNPALQQTINAATLPIEQNLLESTLPAIRSGAVGSQQFGGTRQGIAEGLASGRASQAIGATGAGIANTGYNTGIDAMTKALALLPQTQQAQLAPGLATSGVGDVRQAQTQALMGQTNLYEQYPQLLPLLVGQTLAGIGAGIPAQGSTTTGTASQANPLMQAAGLGISGLGALGGGSGIAALMPFLSDRRLKENIRQIGALGKIPVYEFTFKGSDTVNVGCMADEVPEEYVFDIMGFKVVDYCRLLAPMGV